MVVTLLEILVGERFQQRRPACVQARNQPQRNINGQQAAVGQVGPGGLFVRNNGGPIFGERQLAAYVGHGVAVGDMMHHLPDRPAAFAVARVELGIAQSVDGSVKALRQQANSLYLCGADAGRAAGQRAEAADGIAEVVQICHGMSPVSSLW